MAPRCCISLVRSCLITIVTILSIFGFVSSASASDIVLKPFQSLQLNQTQIQTYGSPYNQPRLFQKTTDRKSYRNANNSQGAKKPTNHRTDFISWLIPKIEQVKREMGDSIVPVHNSIMIAQAALESGWGRSWSAKNKFNLFGLTAGKEKTVRFTSYEDSIRYYLKTISNHRAYAKLRNNLASKSPLELINLLGSYSESSDYAVLLKSIIKSNGLLALDTTDQYKVPPASAVLTPAEEREPTKIPPAIDSDGPNLSGIRDIASSPSDSTHQDSEPVA